MADSSGRGPTKPLYRVDGQLADQRPPKAEGRVIEAVEGPGRDGRNVVTMGPARSRPAFPRRPLDQACLEPADLPEDQKAEVVRWVRKAQPDFDPERDPNGWISVAVKVRRVGYRDKEILRMGYPELEHVFRSMWPRINLEATGNIFLAAETSTASIVHIGGAPESKPEDRAAKVASDEGKSHSKRKMRPEEHLLLLYFRDPKVATLESRSLPSVAEAEFGERFSDRAYRGTDLYGEWRTALEETVCRHGSGWMEGDVLEAGLQIYGAKPGRSDKRPTLDSKHEAAVKDFLRDAANAAARAKARLEDGGK